MPKFAILHFVYANLELYEERDLDILRRDDVYVQTFSAFVDCDESREANLR